MGYHIEKYFINYPDEIPITDETPKEDVEVLLKAEEFGYIVLKRPFTDIITYTNEQLIQARMWEEKGCLDEE